MINALYIVCWKYHLLAVLALMSVALVQILANRFVIFSNNTKSCKLIFYYKSRDNPYQYCKSRKNLYISTTSHMRICISALQVTWEFVPDTTCHVCCVWTDQFQNLFQSSNWPYGQQIIYRFQLRCLIVVFVTF